VQVTPAAPAPRPFRRTLTYVRSGAVHHGWHQRPQERRRSPAARPRPARQRRIHRPSGPL